MSFFTVTRGSGIATIQGRIEKAAAEVPELVQKALSEVGDDLKQALSDAAPRGVGRTEGHLADSFQMRQEEDSVVILSTQKLKFNWVRYGTMDKSPIRPRVKKAMWWPEAGYPRRTVSGQQAQDFVTPILDETEQYVEQVLEPFAKQLTAILEGD